MDGIQSLDCIQKIIAKVSEDRKGSHTNSAHSIDSADNSLLITQLQKAFPDCRVYIATMVSGIHDKKTFIEERVRVDLRGIVENPRLCVVVDWSSL
jgi:hypothetical protein